MSRKKNKKTERQLNTHFMPFKHDYPHAEVKEDGSEVHRFRFAFPRGQLDKRMSGLELCTFIVNHMMWTIQQGLLNSRPDIEQEFKMLYIRLITYPQKVLDRLLPWIKVIYHEDDFDYIYLNINEKRPQLEGPTYFT